MTKIVYALCKPPIENKKNQGRKNKDEEVVLNLIKSALEDWKRSRIVGNELFARDMVAKITWAIDVLENK
jgi:hypothetical protein